MKKHEACRELMSEISEYVDGSLSEDLCADLERHLSECEDCTIVVNTLKKTIELVHQNKSGDESLPDGVRDRLFLRLDLNDYAKK